VTINPGGQSLIERVPPGLCGECRHSRRIETRRGSVFRLCERATSDRRYPRYPTLPVLSCAGFEPTIQFGDVPSST
jgi:hypothetical protein